jgi:DNA-binding NarL/FixJ family response regulator
VTAVVWVERPGDGGSAVWGCDSCGCGEWCSSFDGAIAEAGQHAKHHTPTTFRLLSRRHGPAPSPERDARIAQLYAEGLSHRAIATTIGGITHAAVSKALKRIRRAG